MVQTIKNSPTSGGIYLNPLVDVYGFPRGQDLSEYATNFEKFDENRNMPVQSLVYHSERMDTKTHIG